ncbi:MAG: capsule assembly Wzi family protein, partial [Flavobacteriaceae bacterium]
NNLLTLRLQHYVQWAGTSPVYGKLKSDFEAFIDVFTARKSSEIGTDGEIYNAVGNHLGTYLFDYQFKNPWGAFSLYHEHPFEDGSGTRFANFPDGIWGVYFQPKESNFLNGFLYEFITTKDQSVGSVGYDNYFSNNVYRSGWSYERHIIGLPFMLIDPAVEITPLNSPILSNRVVAHHFGLSGTFKKVAWTLKSSIVQNLSSYLQSETTNLHFWYNYLDLQYTTQDVGTFRAFGGLDTGNSLDTTAGLGLGYRYSF